jgi:hypothetical protein
MDNTNLPPASTLPATAKKPFGWWKLGGIAAALAAAILLGFMYFWSTPPVAFDVQAKAQEHATANNEKIVSGYVMTNTAIVLTQTLLDKRGGYLSNDKFPPGALMDDMPNWEFGVLQQLRDFSYAMRNDFSRAQSQSNEDKDLAEAQPLYSSPNDRWLFPSTENQLGKAQTLMASYAHRLADPTQPTAQFFARADNLAEWLGMVEKHLGSLSQRLSASVGAEPSSATADTTTQLRAKTPWRKIDDNFYEARGSAYALIHLLKATQIDFAAVLADKNAGVSLQQIINELEETQSAIWSPVILNGRGYGFFANHSLVMANYISRANAAIADLRTLLRNG